MARSALSDPLQVGRFWLLDIGPIQALSLPIFTPSMGFNGITSPEIELEVEEIKEGNWPLKRKVVTGGSVNTITLRRGVALGDGDFYKWVMTALYGDKSLFGSTGPLGAVNIGGPTYRRTFMLLHYLARSPVRGGGGVTSILSTALSAASAIGTGQALTALAGLAVAQGLGIGPFETFALLPAKGWILQGCIPTRYKAGGDFDASSADVSIAELDFVYESFEEISLAS